MAKDKKDNEFEVLIKIEKDEFTKAMKQAFDKKSKDIKMDGFRKGKVPYDTYLKKFGESSLYMDTVDILLPNAYKKAIIDNKYEPIMEPKIDLKWITNDGCELSFIITTMPEVKIKKYKGLKVKAKEAKVTKEEIDKEIEQILERYSELKIKEKGKVELGNVAIIDFEGFKDGVAFDGGKGGNYSLEIGSNTFIPGFEEQVIGMKKDESKDLKVTFPEEYGAADLAGKEVVFKVKVNEIKEKVSRTLDKELFEDLGLEGVDSKEALEKEIEANILVNKEKELENEHIDELLKAIAKETTVDIPEELIHEEIHSMMHKFEEQMKMQGISMEVYYEITKSTSDDLHKQMEEEAKNHILYRFILDTIKKKEKIEATEEEASKELEELSKKYGMELEEFKKMYGDPMMMKYELEVRKTIDFLKENNK